MLKCTDVRPIIYIVDNLPAESDEYQIVCNHQGYLILSVWDYEDLCWRILNRRGTIQYSKDCRFDTIEEIVHVINQREFGEPDDDSTSLASSTADNGEDIIDKLPV